MKKIAFLSLLFFFLFFSCAFPLFSACIYALMSDIVFYSVSANASESTRTGTMSIAGQRFTVTQEHCRYFLSPARASIDPEGSIGTVYILTQNGCPLTAKSYADWVIIGKIVNAEYGGYVEYHVAVNTSGRTRIGTLNISGVIFRVTQKQCIYSISPSVESFDEEGGTGAVNVTTQNGCPWTATNNDDWITFTSSNNGSGNGTLTYSVGINTEHPRTGVISIAGQTFTPLVSITAMDPNAFEEGQYPGTFTIIRTGVTTSALIVKYTIGGNATLGTDYSIIGSAVTIPVGSSSTSITIVPVDDDHVEGYETVVLVLSDSDSYIVGSPSSASVRIIDNDSLLFFTDNDSISVPKGGTATFQVKLTKQPLSQVTVSVTKMSGDPDITVQSGSSLIFTTDTWNAYQAVILASRKDCDAPNGTATIRVSGEGIPDLDVNATEIDCDTEGNEKGSHQMSFNIFLAVFF